MNFEDLGLSPALAQAAAAAGFVSPTAIQREAIPLVLAGADLQAGARTGSGKTAAYGLPLLQALQTPTRTRGPGQGVRALVLLPTRELAQQGAEVLGGLARALPARCKIVSAFGGVSINPQMLALRGGCDLLLATPGRLLDLVEQGAVDLSATRHLVLDEADRLLDLGFADELQRVLALLPAERQSLFFSATYPEDVQALAAGLLQAPRVLQVEDEADGAPAITQRAIAVDTAQRTPLLRQLLKDEAWPQVLVFVATRYAADLVAEKLRRGGVLAAAFHGELSQGARTRLLDDFKSGYGQVVVTTDLAARGIDIRQLPAVINYDLPRSATDYTHRIGRTGRAGQPGLAISFVPAAGLAHWRLIEKRQGQRVALEQVAGFEPVEEAPAAAAVQAPGNGGVKGKRPSKKDKLRAAAAAAAAGDGAQEG